MIRVPTIPKSRSARVRRHERSGKTLSSTYLDRRLPRRYHRLEHLASLKLVVSLYKTSTVRFSSRPTHFGPKHVNHSTPIGPASYRGLVQSIFSYAAALSFCAFHRLPTAAPLS